MITYDRLERRPTATPSLIGMAMTDFDELWREFCLAHTERLNQTKLTRQTKVLCDRITINLTARIGAICLHYYCTTSLIFFAFMARCGIMSL